MIYQNNIFFLLFFQILLNLVFYIKYKKIVQKINIYDKPNFRKKHKFPVPLVGGILIFFNISFLIFFSKIIEIDLGVINNRSFIFGYVSFFIIGLYDDKYNMKAGVKLILFILILAAILYLDKNLVVSVLKFSFLKSDISLGMFDTLITILFFLLFINAFNMFDGINCQNGIYSVILLFVLILIKNNNIFFYGLLFSILIFNYFNFRSKLFLGDSGSLSLGFLFSYFFIYYYNNNLIQFSDTIYLYMYLPGLDLLRLYIIRIKNKSNPFSPDRNHIHHYLLDIYGYNKTILIIFSMIIFPIILNFYFKSETLLINVLTLLFYLYFIVFKFRNNYSILK